MIIDFQFLNEEKVLLFLICFYQSLNFELNLQFIYQLTTGFNSNLLSGPILLFSLIYKVIEKYLTDLLMELSPSQNNITDYYISNFLLSRPPLKNLNSCVILQVECTDPSRMVRPEPIFANKPIETFRQYEGTSSIHERVFRTYKLMHTHQTTEFAQRKVQRQLIDVIFSILM